MRNRGIELFMLPDPHQVATSPQPKALQKLSVLKDESASEAASAAEAHCPVAHELECVMAADGVPGWQPAACLAAAHLQLVAQAKKLHRYGCDRLDPVGPNQQLS